MEYTVQELSTLSHVSPRTIRYYDSFGLLKPLYINESGYRIYGPKEVDLLQNILLYKELGFDLTQIKKIIYEPSFNLDHALENHLSMLYQRRNKINVLIDSVISTLKSNKGESRMSDQEKFKGFVKELVRENDDKFGEEVKSKFGDKVYQESNHKILNMTESEYRNVEALSEKILLLLKSIYPIGDPTSDDAMELASLHAKWLKYYWPKNTYSFDAHLGLANMYVEDERFKAYYDGAGVGATEFLRDVIKHYVNINKK